MSKIQELNEKLRDHIQSYFEEINDFSFKPNSPQIKLHEPTFGPDEIMAFVQCLLTTHVTMGPKVKKFEREFADSHSLKHGVMSNSGSSANLLAIASLSNVALKGHLKPGDEVIVPALSWSTTVWPLIQHNLVPVIVDIDPKTLNIDPSQIEKAIGPKTRALMIVPVYGNPCDMDSILTICQEKDLILIEDCCEALGASYDGKPVGTFGRVSTFSFYFSHHISTLEGGITCTDDRELAELMRILRAHGWVREVEDKDSYLKQYPQFDPRFLFVNLGYNLRPTEPQGAMGSLQLPKLKSFVETRRRNAQAWSQDFCEFEERILPQLETSKGYHSWFGFPLTLTPEANFSVSEMRSFLESKGIETRPIICGNVAAQPGMKLYPHRIVGDLKHADRVMHQSFSFGNHHFIGEEARSYITSQVKAFLKGKGAGVTRKVG